jgi:Pyridoxamine 5'-phosphate oxidase
MLRLATRTGEDDRMLTWAEFAAQEPQMAASGRALLYQYGGVGLAFLGTVRPDGGPRVHPMCPILHRDGLYALLIPGPKRGDLHRDPRYALHCFPPEDNENAFYLTGTARPVADDGVRREVASAFLAERSWASPPPGFAEQELFEFLVERALLTTTTGHGDHDPRHRVWSST